MGAAEWGDKGRILERAWDLGLGAQAAAFLRALGSLERQQMDARWLGLAKAGLQLVGGGSKGEW